MKLTEMFYQNISVGNSASAQGVVPAVKKEIKAGERTNTSKDFQTKPKFDNYLDRASGIDEKPNVGNEKRGKEVVSNAKKVDSNAEKPIDSENAVTDEAVAGSTVKGEAITAVKETEKEGAVTETELTDEQSEKINNDIITEIAKVLNMSYDEIAQILASLNLQAVDLAQPENMSAFVQKLLGAASPAELLSIEGASTVFKELNTVMKTFSQNEIEKFIRADNSETGQIVPSAETGETILPEFEQVLNEAVSEDIVIVDVEKEPVVPAAQITGNRKTVEDNINNVSAQTTAIDTNVDITQAVKTTDGSQNLFQQSGFGRGGELNQNEVINQPASAAIQQTAVNTAESNVNVVANANQLVTEVTQAQTTDQAQAQVQSQLQVQAPLQIQAEGAVMTEQAAVIDTQDVIDQIVEKFKVDVKIDTTEIKITLKPEHLGDVSLKIATRNGIVTAQFVAESQRVKEIIEADFNRLRQSLEEQGVRITQLEVSVGQGDGGATAQFENRQERSARRIRNIISGIQAADGDDNVLPENNGIVNMSEDGVDYVV